MGIPIRTMRKLVAAIATVPMLLTGFALTAGTAVAADPEVPSANLIADYDFTTKPADGKTVANTADGSALGAAEVQNPADNLWADSALTLSGGAKTGTGSWVKLPADLLAGKDAATVQMEVKADASMVNAFHFLWNIGNDSSDTEYFFATLNCGSGRNPLVGLKSGGKETLVQSHSCVAKADTWMSVTATIDGTTAKLYVDGMQVASGNAGAKLSTVKDQSLNAIGRSPWPDPLFKGAVSTFRVYDAALNADQIADLSTYDAAIHADELTKGAIDALNVPGEIDGPVISLPTTGGVSWTSSDPATIDPATGKVTQPAKGAADKNVTLTASITVRGQTATKEFPVIVKANSKDDAALLNDAATAYAIPGVVRSGDALPQVADGVTATVKSTGDGIAIKDGTIVIDGATNQNAAAKDGTITVAIGKDGITGTVEKTFAVKVLPADASATIAAYDRNATNADQANNGDVAYSMHLALANGDGTYTPYNENYGVFFARSPQKQALNENLNANDYRSLRDPSLFRMADGSYGVIAVRTNRGTATGDSTAKSSVLIATSKDLLTYAEQEDSGSIVDLGETNGVNRPYAVYDSAAKRYVVGWADDAGIAKYTTFTELKDATSKHGDLLYGSVARTGTLAADAVKGIDDFRTGATIAVDAATVKAINTRYGRATNIGETVKDPVIVPQGSTEEDLLKALNEANPSVKLTYSDGSTGSLPISFWNTEGVDLTKDGEYRVIGGVKQTEYQVPFAEERADPSVYKWQWKHTVTGEDGVAKEVTETKYLMIATNDIYGDNVGQHGTPHMPIRIADTIDGLADKLGDLNGMIDANGYNGKEFTLLSKGDKNADGQAMTGSFWAPEFHEINGNLTILFMPSYNNKWSDGASAYMQLKKDANGDDLDPTKAENWTVPKTILRKDGRALAATASGGVGMSLDMTYFQDADGQSYYAWQQLGATYIATMDPADPAHVTSDPVRIVTPEYAWNAAIAEGPNVTMRDGKLYMMFSGSGVGKTYTTGLAVADASGSDLTDPDSWTVLNYPIQKSGPFNGTMQLGTGHGMWSEDEDGNQIYVFHAYATNKINHDVNSTGRDMFVRRVHWAADGMPVFDMSADEELNPDNRSFAVTVLVSASEPEPPASSDASLKSLSVAGASIDLEKAASAGGASVEVADPSAVTKDDVEAAPVDAKASAEVVVADSVVTVTVTAEDGTTQKVYKVALVKKAEPVPECRPLTFSDVTAATPHKADIDWLACKGISTGWPTGEGTAVFSPMGPVVRQDMAAFLYRLAGSPEFTPSDADKARFTDVDESTPHYKEVLWLAHAGIADGFKQADSTFQFGGNRAVVRQDMAAFLKRLADYRKADPALGEGVAFTDVDAATPHVDDIQWLARTGVAGGYEDGSFGGMRLVVRQDMAAFLHRMDTNVLTK